MTEAAPSWGGAGITKTFLVHSDEFWGSGASMGIGSNCVGEEMIMKA